MGAGVIHDQNLLDELSELTPEQFQGEVFRATGVSNDPLAFSTRGGRWSPPPHDAADVPVLYTSMERDGALAEFVSFLLSLVPVPRSRPLKVSRLRVSTVKTLRLVRVDLERLGIDMTQYGERDYDRTQKIGAALAFLEFDGLITPSARWNCDNLTIFQVNPGELFEVIDYECIDWGTWARANGLIVP